MSDAHPLDNVWDAVFEASEDEDSRGRLKYDEDEPGLGSVVVAVGGSEYVVSVAKRDDRPI